MKKCALFRLGASLSLVLAFSSGCSSEANEPTYEGCATDENWRTFDDYISTQRITNDGSSAPKWLMPSDGWTGNAATPVTFQWQPTPTNAGSPDGNVTCATAQAQSLRLTLKTLRPLHEPPVSGTVYDLHFSIAGTEVYRVLSTHQSTSVPAETWQDFAGKHVDVKLYSAQLLKNDVIAGLFLAPALQIYVNP